MTLEQAVTAHMRLNILQVLAAMPGYALAAATICDALRERGVPGSFDRVHTQIRWLEEQGLLTTERFAGELEVATLTGRGYDAATGLAEVPGVKRPRPGGGD